MSRSIDFITFQANCPLTHEIVIDKLVNERFAAFNGKRRETCKRNLTAIVEATFDLANQIGFAKMSMRDLHQACGLSLGGLYNYFENKEALALMLTDAINLIAFDWLSDFSQTPMPKTQKLEQLVRGHIYLSEILRPWFYFVFMESKNLPAVHKKKARDAELHFQKKLEDLYDGEVLPASHVMALMQDWHVKHWKYKGTSIDAFADSVNRIAQSFLDHE